MSQFVQFLDVWVRTSLVYADFINKVFSWARLILCFIHSASIYSVMWYIGYHTRSFRMISMWKWVGVFKQQFFFVCLFVLFFLGLHLWHMEVPRLGIKLELHCQPRPQPQQRRIWAASATYITAHSNAGSLSHWVNCILMDTNKVHYCWATIGTP